MITPSNTEEGLDREKEEEGFDGKKEKEGLDGEKENTCTKKQRKKRKTYGGLQFSDDEMDVEWNTTKRKTRSQKKKASSEQEPEKFIKNKARTPIFRCKYCSFFTHFYQGLAVHFGSQHKEQSRELLKTCMEMESSLKARIKEGADPMEVYAEMYFSNHGDISNTIECTLEDSTGSDSEICKEKRSIKIPELHETEKKLLLLASKYCLPMSVCNDIGGLIESAVKSYECNFIWRSLRGKRTLWRAIDDEYSKTFGKTGNECCLHFEWAESDLKFFFEDPTMMIKQLLLDPNLTTKDSFDFSFQKHTSGDSNQRIYSEISSGTWMEEITKIVQQRFGSDVHVLGITLYLDGTALGNQLRKSVKPVYIQIANHSYRTRCQPHSRRLITYLNTPLITRKVTQAEQYSYNRQYYQKYIEVSVESIYKKHLLEEFISYEKPNVSWQNIMRRLS